MADFDPQNPLIEEDQALPSQKLESDYQKQKSESFTKHLADSIRSSHPELKDASDQEAFNVVHKVEIPDASPDEYWKVLTNLYGKTWKAPEPPSLLKKVGATIADFPTSMYQDITAIPKGVAETVQGIAKTAGAQAQTLKGLAFGQAPATPSEELQQGQQLVEKGKAHLARGGAFAAGLAATELTAGIVNPATAKLGETFIPKLAANVIKGATTGAAFMAPYEATREAAKPDPSATWDAFVHGATSGAEFGAVLGAGAGTIHPIVKRAMKAGEATSSAKTLPEAKAAASQFANMFEPEWTPPETPPADFAKGLITELHGEDVANSEAGKKAISLITKKINKYQADLMKNAFKDTGVQEGGTGFLESESPQAAALKKQRVTSEGPVWIFGVETKPGTVEVHNIAAETQGEATQLAEKRATALGGKLSGDVAPEYERQQYERRVSTEPTSEDRRSGPRREEEMKQIQDINEQAKSEVTNIETMDRDSLVKAFEEAHPNQPLAYEDTEQLRDVLRREAQSRLQGTASLMESDIPRAQYDVAPQAEITKSLYNPKYEEEFLKLKEGGASDAEIEHVLRKSYQSRYGLSSEMASNEPGKVHAGFDPSLIRKLSAKMYQNGLGKIIPKELVQNALDSVRGIPGGKISVEASTQLRKGIKVVDNGTGMAPETVKRELVDLGSSLKPEGASGGFGLAKAALFANAEDIHIITTAEVDGKKIQTTLHGSGEAWADPKKGLNFSTKEMPLETPTGTSVELKFPDKDVEGNKLNWSLSDVRSYGSFLNSFKNIDTPIDFKVDGDPVYKMPGYDNPTLVKEFKQPGANIDLYSAGKEYPQSYVQIHILNHGIPQFSVPLIFVEPVNFPKYLVADVKSTVDPSNTNYPFTTSREALSGSIESTIKHFVSTEMLTEAINKEKNRLKDVINNAPKIGKWKVLDPTGELNPELLANISNTPEYHSLLGKMQEGFDLIQNILKKHDEAYGQVKLLGFSTNSEHLGVNIHGPKTTGDSFNHIAINPWTTMDEVRNRMKLGITDKKDMVKDFLGQIASTIEHEITHQVARGHDVIYSGALTRNIGHVGTSIIDVLTKLLEGVQDEPNLIKTILKHSEDLQRENSERKGENLFAKVSDSLTGDGGHPSSPGVPQAGEEGRIKPQEAVSPSNVNAPENIPTGTKGTGNLSPVEQARIRFDIPPKGEDAKKNYEVWKQSVLRQHEKTVKKFKLLRDMHRETTGKETE